jgi:hypothetical protein
MAVGRLTGMRLLTGVLACLLSTLALVACDEGESDEPVSAARLPDNLCGAVPDEVVARWRLVEAAHDTEQSADRNEATCAMTGRVDGLPVTLELRLTSYAAPGKDAARALVAGELEDRCASLEAGGGGRFADTDRRCSVETASRPSDQRGRVTEVSISTPAGGLLTVSMAHAGPTWQLVGAEVVGISGSIANADPAELTRRSGARRS